MHKNKVAPLSLCIIAFCTTRTPQVRTIPLAEAAQRGNVNEVSRLLMSRGNNLITRLFLGGADVNESDRSGKTALMYAAQEGHGDIVHLLLERGADVNHVGKNGNTALIYAASTGHLSVMDMLLSANARVDEANHEGKTALIHAAENGHSAIVALLLDRGAIDRLEKPALIHAAQFGRTETVRQLLDRGADVNVTDEQGETSLMRAVRMGHMEVVHLLLDRGARVNQRNRQGLTALQVGSMARRLNVVNLLILAGADVNHGSDLIYTALILAAQNNYDEIVTLLLEGSEDIRYSDRDGKTALMAAASKGSREIASLLLAGGTDINHVSNYGDTALTVAARSGHIDMTYFLLQARLLDHSNSSLCTAINLASRNGHTEIVKLLVSALEIRIENSLSENHSTPATLEELRNLRIRALTFLENEGSKLPSEIKNDLKNFVFKKTKATELKLISSNLPLPDYQPIDTTPELGDCPLCFKEETQLYRCAAGTPGCERRWCSECIRQGLSVLIKNKSNAAICEDCGNFARPGFFSDASLDCQADQINELCEMQLRVKLKNIPNWVFCHNGECSNGEVFPLGTKRSFHCDLCGFKGCLDCGLGHSDSFDSDGRCEGGVPERKNKKKFAVLEKQGKLARLAPQYLEQLAELPPGIGSGDQRRFKAIQVLKTITLQGTPCPICQQEVGDNHSVKHHIYDCKFRPCPWCGMMTEKNGACNHMKCANPRCPGDHKGRKDYSWKSGNIAPTDPTEPDKAMDHPNDVRNQSGFRSWWPSQDR